MRLREDSGEPPSNCKHSRAQHRVRLRARVVRLLKSRRQISTGERLGVEVERREQRAENDLKRAEHMKERADSIRGLGSRFVERQCSAAPMAASADDYESESESESESEIEQST